VQSSTNVESFIQATWKGETEECLDAMDVFSALLENHLQAHAVSVTLDSTQ